MKPEILSLSYQDLDFTPRRDALPEKLERAWSLPVPRRSMLLRHGDQLVVTDRKSIGLLQDSAWSPLEIALKHFTASMSGDLILTDASGTAHLWRPPEPPTVVWRSREEESHSVVSLGSGRLLVLRFAEGTMSEAYAIDAAEDRVLWRIYPGFHLAAAVPQGILGWTPDTDMIQCFDTASGALRWRTPWPGGMDLIGIVDGILWGPGRFLLHRVNCETGEMLAPVVVENAHAPTGVLDERGVFHCCHGLNYQTYDLRDGRRLSYAEFRITAAGPTLGAGRGGMIVTTDGRMMFRDQRHALWMVHSDRAANPELIVRLDGTVGELAARGGQLLVAEDSGAITAFG